METPAAIFKRQSWFDHDEYPFDTHYLNLPSGKMHYVDEGRGNPIVFVHGTPSWSFLYRNLIKEFSDKHRCVALDHLGFGLSQKPKSFAGRPEDHYKHFELLMEHLELSNITLVVHDFGGPIALPYAINNPEKVERIVMFNTWLWSNRGNKDVEKIDGIVNSWIGKHLYLRWNFSPWILLKQAFDDKSKLTKDIHNHYKKVFRSKSSRYGLLKIAQSLLGSSEWYQQHWERIDAITDKPFLLLWGMNDDFIKPKYLEKWEQKLTNYEVSKLNCGHFVQEEQPEVVNDKIRSFINSTSKQTVE